MYKASLHNVFTCRLEKDTFCSMAYPRLLRMPGICMNLSTEGYGMISSFIQLFTNKNIVLGVQITIYK